MKYLDKDLITIHEALVKNEVTVKDLINEAHDNIEKTNTKLNAFNLVLNPNEVEVTDDIISGIPYALKDNISTKGIRTTACSDTLKDYIPQKNIFWRRTSKCLKDKRVLII